MCEITLHLCWWSRR